MVQSVKKDQIEFKVGGHKPTNFWVDEQDNKTVRTKAGPYEIGMTDSGNFSLSGVTEKGIFNKKRVGWKVKCEYDRLYFLKDDLKVEFRIKGDEIYFKIGDLKDILRFKSAGVTGEREGLLNLRGVQEAVELHRDGKLELPESHIKILGGIKNYAEEIQQAAIAARDVNKLKHHPEVSGMFLEQHLSNYLR